MNAILDRIQLARAERKLRCGDLAVASRILRRLSPSAYLTSEAWRLRGRLLLALGEPLRALAAYGALTRHPPVRRSAILEWADVLVHTRSFEPARTIYEKLLADDPSDRHAARGLAHLYRAQGRYETALDVLRTYRPRRAVAKYADQVAPAPRLAWDSARLWERALQQAGHLGPEWSDPAAMAVGRRRRDALICFFDDLLAMPGGRAALVHGLGKALDSDVPWLLRYVRETSDHLRLHVPCALPMFLARHGSAEDKPLLLAALAEGGRHRVLAGAALMALGFGEYEEVLRELRAPRRPSSVAEEVWLAAEAILSV